MASVVILKKSSIGGKVPQPADLQYGELAINYADGLLYYKKPDNTIDIIGGSGGSVQSTRSVYEEITIDGQTNIIFPGGYTYGFLDVYLNGVQLTNADYTATDGNTIILAEPAKQGDIIRCITISAITLVDTYRKAEVDQIAESSAITMAIALG